MPWFPTTQSWLSTTPAWFERTPWRKEHPEALRLPAILPIVLYQGATPWTAPRTLAELYDLSDQALRDLSELLLSLRFVLDDLRVTPDDALMERRVTDLVRVALVVMKHVTSGHLLDQLVRLRDEVSRLLATEEGCIGLSGILWYLRLSTRTSSRSTSSAIWVHSWARSSRTPWKPTKRHSDGCG